MTVRQGPPSDRDLLVEIEAGDRGALHELFDRHQPWLAARVRRRCSDPEIVNEVVDATFLLVWQHPGKYRETGDVDPVLRWFTPVGAALDAAYLEASNW